MRASFPVALDADKFSLRWRLLVLANVIEYTQRDKDSGMSPSYEA